MSLLDKAKKFTPQRVNRVPSVSEEELEVLFAFLEKRITLYQVGSALKISKSNYSANVWSWLGVRLRRAVNNGQIKIVKIEEMEK